MNNTINNNKQLPKELVEEIISYTPQYKYIRIKFMFIYRVFDESINEYKNGFKVEEGERILRVTDYIDEENKKPSSLYEAISDNCAVISPKYCLKFKNRSLEKLLESENGTPVVKKEREEYSELLWDYEKYEIIERW